MLHAVAFALAQDRPEPLQLHPGDRVGVWSVTDAAGHRLSTTKFARLAGDDETLRRLDREADLSRLAGVSLVGAGGVLLTASLMTLAGDIGAPDEDDYEVDLADYRDYESYAAARDRAEENYDDAQDRYDQEKLWAGAFFGVAGAIAISVAPFTGRDARARRENPELVYTEARARALVDAHNARITPILTPTGVGVQGSF